MSRNFRAQISPLPPWLDWRRLVGPGDWTSSPADGEKLQLEGALDRAEAADLLARLRRVGIGGEMLSVEVSPIPNRKELRNASTEEARRHRQRSVGFSQPGVRLDEEGKISLTPEAIALALGERTKGKRVIDACAGAGGNVIGFARAGCSVVAIELDPQRLAMAQHNAKIYGVADRIQFIQGDACTIVPDQQADLLFIDPPWGGDYDKSRVTLSDLPPAEQLIESAKHIGETWIKAPPSFDPSTLPSCQPEAIFGCASGDERRVKFLLLQLKN